MKSWRDVVVGVKIEAVKGVAETLAAADCALLAFEPELNPDIEFEKRRPSGIGFGHLGSVPGEFKSNGRIRVELKGSGTAATQPIWSRLLEASGMVATPGVDSVVFSLAEAFADQLTATVAIWRDGVKSLAAGCCCDFEITGEGGKAMFIEFTPMGVWYPDTDEAAPTPITHESTLPIRLADALFELDSSSYGKLSRFSLRGGNDVQLRGDIEQASALAHAYIADRDPTVAFDPEMVSVASDDVHGDMIVMATKPLAVELPKAASATAGNQWLIDVLKLQRMNPQKRNRLGLAVYDFTADIVGGAEAYTLTHK